MKVNLPRCSPEAIVVVLHSIALNRLDPSTSIHGARLQMQQRPDPPDIPDRLHRLSCPAVVNELLCVRALIIQIIFFFQ